MSFPLRLFRSKSAQTAAEDSTLAGSESSVKTSQSFSGGGGGIKTDKDYLHQLQQSPSSATTPNNNIIGGSNAIVSDCSANSCCDAYTSSTVQLTPMSEITITPDLLLPGAQWSKQDLNSLEGRESWMLKAAREDDIPVGIEEHLFLTLGVPSPQQGDYDSSSSSSSCCSSKQDHEHDNQQRSGANLETGIDNDFGHTTTPTNSDHEKSGWETTTSWLKTIQTKTTKQQQQQQQDDLVVDNNDDTAATTTTTCCEDENLMFLGSDEVGEYSLGNFDAAVDFYGEDDNDHYLWHDYNAQQPQQSTLLSSSSSCSSEIKRSISKNFTQSISLSPASLLVPFIGGGGSSEPSPRCLDEERQMAFYWNETQRMELEKSTRSKLSVTDDVDDEMKQKEMIMTTPPRKINNHHRWLPRETSRDPISMDRIERTRSKSEDVYCPPNATNQHIGRERCQSEVQVVPSKDANDDGTGEIQEKEQDAACRLKRYYTILNIGSAENINSRWSDAANESEQEMVDQRRQDSQRQLIGDNETTGTDNDGAAAPIDDDGAVLPDAGGQENNSAKDNLRQGNDAASDIDATTVTTTCTSSSKPHSFFNFSSMVSFQSVKFAKQWSSKLETSSPPRTPRREMDKGTKNIGNKQDMDSKDLTDEEICELLGFRVLGNGLAEG